MAKYYVFHYSEVASKKTGEVYCNVDFIPDDDKERVMSVSIKRSVWQEFNDVKDLTPEQLKRYWFEVYSMWNNEYKTRFVNGIRKLGPKQ